MDSSPEWTPEWTCLTPDKQDVSLTWWLVNMESIPATVVNTLVARGLIGKNDGIRSFFSWNIPQTEFVSMRRVVTSQQNLAILNADNQTTVPVCFVQRCGDVCAKLRAKCNQLDHQMSQLIKDKHTITEYLRYQVRELEQQRSELIRSEHSIANQLENWRDRCEELETQNSSLREQVQKLKNAYSYSIDKFDTPRMANPYLTIAL